jgi:hypothetical protein
LRPRGPTFRNQAEVEEKRIAALGDVEEVQEGIAAASDAEAV